MINAVYTEEPYYNDINSMVILSDDKVKTFPVPMLDFSKQADIKKRDKLVVLVDKMLELKAGEQPNATQLKEIQRFDDKIDEFVYKLYNLIDEEIGIVETGFLSSKG